ncbi:MAG: response regulator, partial [Nitrospirales bacterium]
FFTTKAAGKGTGLGLATVYGIMKQSNGFVFCYSEPGMGTTFKLYLPQVDRAPEFLDGTIGDLDLPFGSETVLLVEDEERVRELVSDTLEQYGYTVLVAEDPYHALRLNAQHKEPIHLLVTDVVMPGMSGKEVADRVGETRPEVRVLYMSGYTEDAIVHHGVLEPGVMLLPKPFPSETLVRKVRDVLDMPEERRRKVPVGSG